VSRAPCRRWPAEQECCEAVVSDPSISGHRSRERDDLVDADRSALFTRHGVGEEGGSATALPRLTVGTEIELNVHLEPVGIPPCMAPSVDPVRSPARPAGLVQQTGPAPATARVCTPDTRPHSPRIWRRGLGSTGPTARDCRAVAKKGVEGIGDIFMPRSARARRATGHQCIRCRRAGWPGRVPPASSNQCPLLHGLDRR
jgi:hypothetical protein